jgi:hypothetical protein
MPRQLCLLPRQTGGFRWRFRRFAFWIFGHHGQALILLAGSAPHNHASLPKTPSEPFRVIGRQPQAYCRNLTTVIAAANVMGYPL